MLLLFNKPYGVLCQFTDREGRMTLADYIATKNVYAAGRLDLDSEGLVLLTDDGSFAHRITDPRHKWPKTYWVQVEGRPEPSQLNSLRCGVALNDGPSLPAEVENMATEPVGLWQRNPSIRYRAAIPTHWLSITLVEGRNRQVRRMTAAVGLPTLRLVRERIGPYALAGLAPGKSRVA